MKQIQAGPVALEVDASAGGVSLKASVSQSVGGGAAAGVAKFSNVTELDLGAQQAADLAIGILEHAFPSATALLEMVKSGADAEIGKIVV